MTSASLPLLTVREAAERLRLSLAAVYQMIRSGRLLAIRLGPRRGAIRIRTEDIEQCLEAGEQQPAVTKPAHVVPRRKLKHIRL